MTTRDVTNDAVNPNKTALVAGDRFLIVDSETTPNTLKEIAQSDLVATSSDVNTGTSTSKLVTADAMAGSVLGTKNVFLPLVDPATTPLSTGDAKIHFLVPPELNGMNLVDADGIVSTVSSSGTPTFAIRRERSGSAVDMLSTNITIDVSEKTSYTAANAPVINAANDDVQTGDILYIDLDVVGTGAKGHGVMLAFRIP